MTNGDASGTTVDTIRNVLSAHPVSFAMLFGSSARGTMDDRSDVDLAVEFETYRPEDDGYSEVYLRVVSDLDDSLPTEVDVVDVHSMAPQFASVAFDEGDVIVGTERRRDELEREVAGESPSLESARNRVAAAARRLREGSS